MAPPPSSRPAGALLAAWLLCCSMAMAGAAFSSPYTLIPRSEMASNPQPRREIREVMADTYSAALFIRTLLSLQSLPVGRLDSYSRLAGIHGSRGYFDGVTSGSNGRNGYCIHGEPMFATWHFPYMAVLEQAFYDQAQVHGAEYAASSLPDRDSYVAAARNLRLCYWDWGLQGGQVPDIFFQPTYTLVMPRGDVATFRNPLARFTIPSDAASTNNFGISRTSRTITRAASWTNPSGPVFLSNIEGLRRDILSMLQAPSYDCFVTGSGCPADSTPTGSLEGLHNSMHGTVGGDRGQMGYINLAAFDPIFFLHHCNVDRQLAIWAALNPSAPMDSLADVPIFPFRKSGSAFWTARDFMDVYTRQPGFGTRQFGFFYPELAEPTLSREQLLFVVNQLYNDAVDQRITVLTFRGANSQSVTGRAAVSLSTTTSVPAPTATNSRADQAATTTRRIRRTSVRAGTVPLVTANARRGRFSVERVNVDVTDALAKLKEANPNITRVDISATVIPTNGNGTAANQAAPAVVNLGSAMVTVLVNGQVVDTSAFLSPQPEVQSASNPDSPRPATEVALLQAGAKAPVVAPVVAPVAQQP